MIPEEFEKSAMNRKDKLEILRLQKKIVQLEDDKIELEETLRRKTEFYSNSCAKSNCPPIQSLVDDLRKENSDLHQGMKEILVSLQECDCRSDVNIECPSLEKLCNVLECRSISLDSAACISMKAELDIVRGFNDHLRGEVKRLRRESLNLLNFCTKEISGFEFGDCDNVDDLEKYPDEEMISLMANNPIMANCFNLCSIEDQRAKTTQEADGQTF